MVEIFWTNEAKMWLKEIHDYIELDNNTIAKRVISEIIDKTDILKIFPESGQRLLQWKEENIRMILYGHYRIVYKIISEDRIDILGVYHGALDLKRHFKLQ